MITGISIVSVWVLDQDSAKEFYADKLGFTVTNDLKLDSGMRWLTVRPPGSENQELLLMDPCTPCSTGRRSGAGPGRQGGAVAGGDGDVGLQGDHSTLAGRGVEFTQEPAERPYGVEAIMRDDSGNWYSFTQHKFLEGKA